MHWELREAESGEEDFEWKETACAKVLREDIEKYQKEASELK